jgi:hypothetical protein
VVVQRDADTGLILDEEHPVMARAEVLVDHPLEKHTLKAGGDVGPLADRRNHRLVEMPQKVAPQVVEIERLRV